MKVGIFLLGECKKSYDYKDVSDAYEDASSMTEETDLIHEVKIIWD